MWPSVMFYISERVLYLFAVLTLSTSSLHTFTPTALPLVVSFLSPPPGPLSLTLCILTPLFLGWHLPRLLRERKQSKNLPNLWAGLQSLPGRGGTTSWVNNSHGQVRKQFRPRVGAIEPQDCIPWDTGKRLNFYKVVCTLHRINIQYSNTCLVQSYTNVSPLQLYNITTSVMSCGCI